MPASLHYAQVPRRDSLEDEDDAPNQLETPSETSGDDADVLKEDPLPEPFQVTTCEAEQDGSNNHSQSGPHTPASQVDVCSTGDLEAQSQAAPARAGFEPDPVEECLKEIFFGSGFFGFLWLLVQFMAFFDICSPSASTSTAVFGTLLYWIFPALWLAHVIVCTVSASQKLGSDIEEPTTNDIKGMLFGVAVLALIVIPFAWVLTAQWNNNICWSASAALGVNVTGNATTTV